MDLTKEFRLTECKARRSLAAPKPDALGFHTAAPRGVGLQAVMLEEEQGSLEVGQEQTPPTPLHLSHLSKLPETCLHSQEKIAGSTPLAISGLT